MDEEIHESAQASGSRSPAPATPFNPSTNRQAEPGLSKNAQKKAARKVRPLGMALDGSYSTQRAFGGYHRFAGVTLTDRIGAHG